jgi:hypothetical protein
MKPIVPIILIIDGMGGGIGVQLVEKLRPLEGIELVALGTNAVATERMVKAGADRGASGENAIVRSAPIGAFILGPIGIVIANSMMGELTPRMAAAILDAPGQRILLPLQNSHFTLAGGVENTPLSKMIDSAVLAVKNTLV